MTITYKEARTTKKKHRQLKILELTHSRKVLSELFRNQYLDLEVQEKFIDWCFNSLLEGQYYIYYLLNNNCFNNMLQLKIIDKALEKNYNPNATDKNWAWKNHTGIILHTIKHNNCLPEIFRYFAPDFQETIFFWYSQKQLNYRNSETKKLLENFILLR